ncbi:MAG: molecular chaperone DnaK [Candidatus Caldarchaeum sp.]
MKMPKALGIDLGTTNSVVAVVEFPDSDPKVIATAEGGRTCPSMVAFTKTGERLVGQLAKRQAILNPQNTIYSIKRFMGRRYDEVEKERQMVPYKIVAGPNGMAVAEIEGTTYTPEQISSMILAKLKKDAEAYLGEEVRDAIITVPAYFNDAQRNSTKVAGEVAGFNVLRVLNEPTAAAIAYGVDKQQEGTILVWDLGGGTFDVTILHISGDGVFEVRATNGDTHLGGDDWDEALVNYIAEQFQREQGVDLRRDPQALQRLREAAEKAKCELSSVLQTTISLPFITADATGPKHLEMTLTRAQFEQITRHLCERMRAPFENALKDAGLKVSDIDDIVLVGGSTRMPMVENLIRELTGKEPRKGINPDEVVAIGAAIQAAVMTGMYRGDAKSIVLVDVLPLSLGVETQGGVMSVMIPRNTPLPYRHTEIYTTARDFQDSVEIKILQGERPMARDNRLLGVFALEGIPPAPKGVPRIEVTFDVDANGLLSVSAKDLGTGKSANVRITDSTTLSKEEVQRMIRDAELHAEEDRKRRELIEMRHQLETLCNQATRLLEEYTDSIPETARATLAEALQAGRQQLHSEDLEAIRRACDSLSEASRRAAEALYNQSSAAVEVPETEAEQANSSV